MLTRELSHRVKNTLAVVQALARQPAAPDLTVDAYRERLVGRIQALARAHDQLLETEWQSADLSALVEATLAAYGKIGDRDLKVEGPSVLLTPKQGLGLALILHELATNASKYGSLSIGGGQLSITWMLNHEDEGAQVRLEWQERKGPPIGSEPPDGFGARLIKQASDYELDGSAELCFDPAGLTANITFPVE